MIKPPANAPEPASGTLQFTSLGLALARVPQHIVLSPQLVLCPELDWVLLFFNPPPRQTRPNVPRRRCTELGWVVPLFRTLTYTPEQTYLSLP